MSQFPRTNIGGLDISRLVIGTNPFCGASHFSLARDKFLRRYFTPDRIGELVAHCANQGLNALIAGPSPQYMEILRQVERSTGKHIVYIATPAGVTLDELREGIDQAADLGCELCWPHSTFTDSALNIREDRIEGAPEALAYIRKRGMIPGWSTHRPETVVISDRQGYDVDGYIQIFNATGFLCAVETDWARKIIREAAKPVLCIKPLAAGRLLPPTGLDYVFGNIKSADAVAIGMMSIEEADEDIAIARQCIARQSPQVELQYTRSKETLLQTPDD